MRDDEKKRFGTLIAGMAELFSTELSPAGVDILWRILKKYDFVTVDNAVQHILKTHEYSSMPSPAVFVKAIEGGPEDHAILAAGQVWGAIIQHGAIACLCFSDPTIQAVINQHYGGWPVMCRSITNENERSWWCKEFAEAYKSYKQAGKEEYGPVNQLVNTEVTLIGNKAQAMRVLKGIPPQIGAGDITAVNMAPVTVLPGGLYQNGKPMEIECEEKDTRQLTSETCGLSEGR